MTERRHIDPVSGEVIDDPEIRPFAAFLQERAMTHEELSEGLWDLVARVTETGKKGTLTLVVTVETDKKAGNVLIVSDEIKLKLPEHDRPGAIYWADRNGNLARNDPRQPELDGLRVLPATDPATAKDIHDHA